MYTHKQLKRLTNKLRRENADAWTSTPWIIKARSNSDSSWIGIHLLNPTQDELNSAIETSYRDSFNTIVIHTRRTFGKA